MPRATHDIRDIEVIVPNLKLKHTGVTSTIAALLPVHARHLKIAAVGFGLPADWPQIGWENFFLHGWKRPHHRPFRIWHARRNNEMLAGLLLRSVLRMPLKLVFTSAALRNHAWLTRILLRQMDRVIATSPEAASRLRVPAKIILHGVDVQLYHPLADREKEWLSTGLPGRHGIGVFGRVRRQKGTDLFVESMCRLLPRYPDFSAVIVGAVTPDQKLFSGKLKSKVAAAGLSGRIRFLGELPPPEVRLWMRRMTIVVGPQRWEGFGLVPIEAMAGGAAVVATRAGAAHHLVADGKTGCLVPTDNLEALVEKIEVLMKDLVLATTMGRQGRTHVIEKFTVGREADEIQSVYENCWNEA
ncbi:MAG TPA: glycosyltransferase family 4 protein [Verrucomicrobiae bacterium]